VPQGEGRGWSKGKTKATDPRVARSAFAHVGVTYTRRTPLAELKWRTVTFTKLAIEWSPQMAYIVGLMATDGCLASRSTAMNFKSADRELVATYLELLGRTNKIGAQTTKWGGLVYYTQYRDVRLRRWFESIGLTPRKSLTLGAISAPDEFMAALVRGLLDGDGSISNGVWKADTTRRSDYYYEWLRTRFASASRTHLEWLKSQLTRLIGLRGWIWTDYARRNPMSCLAYGKADSVELLSWLYENPNAPCLTRKRGIWADYVSRHSLRTVESTNTMYA